MYQAYNRPEYVAVSKYNNDTECQSVMFLYYYFLSIVVPAFAACHPMHTARRHLTRALPWMKGQRIPRLAQLVERVNADDKAALVRERLLKLAEEKVRESAR